MSAQASAPLTGEKQQTSRGSTGLGTFLGKNEFDSTSFWLTHITTLLVGLVIFVLIKYWDTLSEAFGYSLADPPLLAIGKEQWIILSFVLLLTALYVVRAYTKLAHRNAGANFEGVSGFYVSVAYTVAFALYGISLFFILYAATTLSMFKIALYVMVFSVVLLVVLLGYAAYQLYKNHTTESETRLKHLGGYGAFLLTALYIGGYFLVSYFNSTDSVLEASIGNR